MANKIDYVVLPANKNTEIILELMVLISLNNKGEINIDLMDLRSYVSLRFALRSVYDFYLEKDEDEEQPTMQLTKDNGKTWSMILTQNHE